MRTVYLLVGDINNNHKWVSSGQGSKLAQRIDDIVVVIVTSVEESHVWLCLGFLVLFGNRVEDILGILHGLIFAIYHWGGTGGREGER